MALGFGGGLMRRGFFGWEGRRMRMTKEELTPHELYALPTRRTLTIITVGCPIKILKWFKDDFRFRPVEPGIYHCTRRA
jgi:hypothetical protein